MAGVSKYIRIDAPRERVFATWADAEAHPQFAEGLRSVSRDGDTYIWEVETVGGLTLTYKTEIAEWVDNEKIAWQPAGGDIAHSGVVRFDERDGATDMEYAVDWEPPGGRLGDAAATLLDNPDERAERMLESFKRLMERELEPRPDSRATVDPDEAAPPEHR